MPLSLRYGKISSKALSDSIYSSKDTCKNYYYIQQIQNFQQQNKDWSDIKSTLGEDIGTMRLDVFKLWNSPALKVYLSLREKPTTGSSDTVAAS